MIAKSVILHTESNAVAFKSQVGSGATVKTKTGSVIDLKAESRDITIPSVVVTEVVFQNDALSGRDGARGPQGPAGADGIDGIDGVDGVDGKSAYEIAVEHGFEGTEQEWLDSLHGGGDCDHSIDTTTLDGKVIVTKDGVSFAIDAELIQKPAAPTITAGANFYNSKDITITAVSGATIRYAITSDGGTPITPTASTGIEYSAAFSIGSTDNYQTTYKIVAVAIKNGMVSDPTEVQTYVCSRRVATPTATASGNKYSASRTITFACDTADATIEYKVGSGEWTEGGSVTINATSTVYFRAKKSDWVTSADGSQSFTLNAPKCYIGGAGASLSSLSGLTGVEADNLNGERTVTLASAAYIWFVVPSGSTITSITSGPLAVPFGVIPNSVSGYNCYRTDLEITAGTYTYNIA